MSIPIALRYDLTKYRKRSKLTLGRSEHGVPYATYRKSRRYVSGMPRAPRQNSYHNNFYNSGTPRSYRPSLNAPAVRVDEYNSYEPLESYHIPRPNNPRSPHSFNNLKTPLSMSLPDDELTQTERFLMSMGKRDEIERVVLNEPTFNINNPNSDEMGGRGEMEQRVLEGPFFNMDENVSEAPEFDTTQLPVELRSVDELPSLEVLNDAFVQLQEALPEDHPDLVNVRTAMRKVRDHQISLSGMDETDAENDIFQFDPYQEAEQFFNQQMALLEKSFDTSAIEPVEGQDMDLEIMPDETMPEEHFMEEQTLEQMIEADPFEASVSGFIEQDMMPDEMTTDMAVPGTMPQPVGYDADMAANEINHAIDQVTGQQMMHEEEPVPFQQQYDPFMAPEYMVDPQMQYMPNYMMPGPMPFGPGMPDPMPGM